jgi:glyoxylase-like metal-dependent hydrolase (beta-lactamase superfamily II)
VTGLSQTDLVTHASGDKVSVGKIDIEWLHTPGHTPGSSCFRVDGALVAGDTLFCQGCGRVDLPGGDPQQMYETLTQRLGALPGDTILWPGHNYGGKSATLDEVRRTNRALFR